MRSLAALVVSLVAASASAQDGTPLDNAQVQARMSSVRSCWERVVREEPTPAKAMLSIEVDEGGAVTRVTAEPLPARLVGCVAARVRTWKFAAGGARTLTYPLVLVTSEPAPR